MILRIPTINDNLTDFDRLFYLWDQVNDDFLSFEKGGHDNEM